MKRVVIELDETTGELKFSLPDNIALTLGLLDMVRELVIKQHVTGAPQTPRIIDVTGATPTIAKQ